MDSFCFYMKLQVFFQVQTEHLLYSTETIFYLWGQNWQNRNVCMSGVPKSGAAERAPIRPALDFLTTLHLRVVGRLVKKKIIRRTSLSCAIVLSTVLYDKIFSSLELGP